MRKTKIRIVGDPDVVRDLRERFKILLTAAGYKIENMETFDTTPYRYAASPGATVYITLKPLGVPKT